MVRARTYAQTRGVFKEACICQNNLHLVHSHAIPVRLAIHVQMVVSHGLNLDENMIDMIGFLLDMHMNDADRLRVLLGDPVELAIRAQSVPVSSVNG